MSATEVVREETRHSVGSVGEFELDRFRVFDLDGRPVGVVRTERGFYAVRNRCPHQGAAICAGIVSGTMAPSSPREYLYSDDRRVVACPWHRWEFDLETGASVQQITKKKLVTYPVEVEDGIVSVVLRGRARKERR
ncbi:MAG: Rieske 2Fe-2S domain-containing protein [Solirubrobacterales bacterium]